MSKKAQNAALAAKYKELALDIQKFLDLQPDNVCDSPECEALTQAQADFCTSYEELTGKSVY